MHWKALVVDDSREARELLSERLVASEFEVDQARDAFEALEYLSEAVPDLVVTDLRMPGQDGIYLVQRIREFSKVPIIVITAYPSVPTCEMAMRRGAQRFLRWRDDLGGLGAAARDLVEAQEAAGESESTEVQSVSTARERRREEFRHQLERLLVECNGNIARIAEHLDRDRATVVYHLKKFGLFEGRGRRG